MTNLLTVKSLHENNNLKWYNHELKALKHDKNKAKKVFYQSKSHNDWKSYTKLRNKYTKALTNAETCYIQNQLVEHKDEPKKLWQTLKSIYSDNNKVQLQYVIFEGIPESEPHVVAEKLNNYFIDSIVDIAQTIPDVSDGKKEWDGTLGLKL